MNQTNTPKDTQKEITDLMKVDLSRGRKTRFSPYISIFRSTSVEIICTVKNNKILKDSSVLGLPFINGNSRDYAISATTWTK